MSRIDVQTLVESFEKRISELNKNPPDQVPYKVIVNMLEQSIGEIIRDHFLYLIKKDIQGLIRKEFKSMNNRFVTQTVKDMLADSSFRKSIEMKVKKSIIENIR